MARGDIVVGDSEARRRRRLLLITVVVVLVVGMVAAVVARSLSDEDSDISGDSSGDATTTTATADGDSAAETIEDDAATVAAALDGSAAPWRAQITSVRVVTLLRRPVIEVTVDIDAESAGDIERFTTSVTSYCATLATPEGMPRTYFLRILSAGGDVVGAVAFPDPRWVLEAPAPPTDGAALFAWLDSVYGSASPTGREQWLDRINAVGEPSEDPEGNVVIATDLDPGDPLDLQQAQTIFDAVNSSGATFAPGIRITFADPSFEWTGLMDGIDPYAP